MEGFPAFHAAWQCLFFTPLPFFVVDHVDKDIRPEASRPFVEAGGNRAVRFSML